ncbi:MAG: prepilin-type N-terminal cleavage/methylation domain-containing protein [Fibrobacterota bacterium]|nr:prepilin-type N-terminal cleavage/methylation domain-containing protein [Fibrobacterota bacterium]
MTGRSTASSGFVLTEILVVAIIVGILAAVAIPTYSGYILDQRKQVAKSIAESGAVAGNIYFRRTGSDPTDDELNVFLTDSSKYTVEVRGRFVVVSDISDSPDIIKDSAAFR